MRKVSIAPDEFYHLYGRGVRKNLIYHDDEDYVRFLFLTLHYQSPERLPSINHNVKNFLKTGDFGIRQKRLAKIVAEREVELICFILMPNHFHLVVMEKKEGGITRYVQRILTAYAMYYNKKYGTTGHVFQGPYGAVLIEDNDQLLYTSAYVHLNCREIKKWTNKEKGYPWSSYQDYTKKNRWGDLLLQEAIIGQFKDSKDYKTWVETSGAKTEELEDGPETKV